MIVELLFIENMIEHYKSFCEELYKSFFKVVIKVILSGLETKPL